MPCRPDLLHTRCRIFIDFPEPSPSPQRGNYVVTVGRRGQGSAYLILKSREVRRREPGAKPRFWLHCKRVALDEVHGFRYTMHWYPRGKGGRA